MNRVWFLGAIWYSNYPCFTHRVRYLVAHKSTSHIFTAVSQNLNLSTPSTPLTTVTSFYLYLFRT
jgi:hypothetical protein